MWTTIGRVRALSILAVACVASLAVVGHTESRSHKQPANCTDINEVLDRCGALASYSHTLPASNYPTSLDELKAACPRHNDGLQCLRQHVKCLKPLTRRAILSFIESRRKHVKLLCSDTRRQEARDFVAAFACIKQHKRDKFIETELAAIKRIQAILDESQVASFEERFQRACCSINQYRERTLDDMRPQCGAANMLNAVESAIDSVVGEAIEFACPDAKSSVCTSMRPLRLAEGPVNKTLTRAGTDLMIVLTSPEAPGGSQSTVKKQQRGPA